MKTKSTYTLTTPKDIDMRKAKVIYHLSYEFFRTEEVVFKSYEELEVYVNIRVGELAEHTEIPSEKISVQIKIEMIKK